MNYNYIVPWSPLPDAVHEDDGTDEAYIKGARHRLSFGMSEQAIADDLLKRADGALTPNKAGLLVVAARLLGPLEREL